MQDQMEQNMHLDPDFPESRTEKWGSTEMMTEVLLRGDERLKKGSGHGNGRRAETRHQARARHGGGAVQCAGRGRAREPGLSCVDSRAPQHHPEEKDAIRAGGNNPQVEGAEAPVLDRSYFVLLKQVSRLDSDNAAPTLELNDAKTDAIAYAEVANEMKDDYTRRVNTLVANNEAAERSAKTTKETT